METHTLYDAPQPRANAEQPNYETQQAYPEKPTAELIADEVDRRIVVLVVAVGRRDRNAVYVAASQR